MSYTIQMKTQQQNYPIKFCSSYQDISSIIEPISLSGRKVCIVTDENVGKYYLQSLLDELEPLVHKVIYFVMEPGEKNKNLETVNRLYETLIQNQFDRESMLIALGGGVVGDLTGFTAATYLRGIDFIQMPTTLLSQVDSSIGGKTGVDFKGYKNMIGAFYQPKLVIINIATLQTLPMREFYSGMAEIIKHGYIRDVQFLNWLDNNASTINTQDYQMLTDMVYKSCCIKQGIVEKDEKEMNIRALLNFGHTIGHAIEKLMKFQLLHGECVSLGMVAAGYISYKRECISLEDLKGMEDILNLYHLPIRIKNVSVAEIIETTKYDKKVKSNVLSFVLLDEVGKGDIYKDVHEKELKEAIEYILQ